MPTEQKGLKAYIAQIKRTVLANNTPEQLEAIPDESFEALAKSVDGLMKASDVPAFLVSDEAQEAIGRGDAGALRKAAADWKKKAKAGGDGADDTDGDGGEGDGADDPDDVGGEEGPGGDGDGDDADDLGADGADGDDEDEDEIKEKVKKEAKRLFKGVVFPDDEPAYRGDVFTPQEIDEDIQFESPAELIAAITEPMLKAMGALNARIDKQQSEITRMRKALNVGEKLQKSVDENLKLLARLPIPSGRQPAAAAKASGTVSIEPEEFNTILAKSLVDGSTTPAEAATLRKAITSGEVSVEIAARINELKQYHAAS